MEGEWTRASFGFLLDECAAVPAYFQPNRWGLLYSNKKI
jgi:hypothetical protein